MNVQIDIAIKHARAYWFVDGFTEMITGGLFVLLAVLLLFSGNAPQSTFPSWFLSVAGEITIAKFMGILAAVLILWWLKDNFTYPRTGFVRGKRVTLSQVLTIIRNVVLLVLLPVIVLLAASMFITSANNVLSSMPAWFPGGLGILWAVLCVLAGEWMGLHRFRLLGTMIFLAGITIGIWQLSMGLPNFPNSAQLKLLHPSVLECINRTLTSLSLLSLVSGLLLVISGILTFLRYRKENPAPYSEEA